MSARPGSRYQPPPMARWKPPAMIAILVGVVVAVISVSRAMGDRGTTGQSVLTWSIVVAAFALVVLVLSVGTVARPLVRTGLVMVGVTLIVLAPLGAVVASEVYRTVVIVPICERLETTQTRVDGVSRTSDGGDRISRMFSRRLQCHYRTADPAVPEGIPTTVDLRDARLAGGRAGPLLFGNAVVTFSGFVLGLMAPFFAWRWWFRAMRREAVRDQERAAVS